jgi:hypothetical protein
MFLGVPVVVDLGATVVCGLKRKRGFLVFGAIVVALAATLAVGFLIRWDWLWVEGWEDAMVGFSFVSFLLPTTIVLLVGALRLGKPGSWWVDNISSDSAKARALARHPTPAAGLNGEASGPT